jgi:hypothetical protein
MEPEPHLSLVESVRCLQCETVYGRPRRGGTARQNPGCPECGYVGWIAAAIPVSEERRRRRFDGDPPPLHRAQSN